MELRECGVRGGLEADRHRTCDRVDRQVHASGVDALYGAVLGVHHEALALEPGGVRMEAEIDDGLDPLVHPGVGDLGIESEPGGGPRGSPGGADLEGLQMIEIPAGADAKWPSVGFEEWEHTLVELAADPPLGEFAVVVHVVTLASPDGWPYREIDESVAHYSTTRTIRRRGLFDDENFAGLGAASAGSDVEAHSLTGLEGAETCR